MPILKRSKTLTEAVDGAADGAVDGVVSVGADMAARLTPRFVLRGARYPFLHGGGGVLFAM